MLSRGGPFLRPIWVSPRHAFLHLSCKRWHWAFLLTRVAILLMLTGCWVLYRQHVLDLILAFTSDAQIAFETFLWLLSHPSCLACFGPYFGGWIVARTLTRARWYQMMLSGLSELVLSLFTSVSLYSEFSCYLLLSVIWFVDHMEWGIARALKVRQNNHLILPHDSNSPLKISLRDIVTGWFF